MRWLHNALMAALEWVGLYSPPAYTAARERFGSQYPTYTACGIEIRSREHARLVVAIYYQEPGLVTRPPRYKLYAIGNDLSEVSEIPCDPDSPYWIRGRK